MLKLLVYLEVGLLCCNLAKAAPGDLDPGFSPPMTNFTGQCFALPDGTTLISGNYTNVNGIAGTNVARLNSDGSVEETFIGGTGPSGTAANSINCVALLSDGKILVGGNFWYFNDVSAMNLVRLNSDGTFDASLITNAALFSSSRINAIKLQSDGKILIGGSLNYSVSGSGYKGLARFNSDGTLDNTFKAALGSFPEVYAIAIQSDGNILIAGSVLPFGRGVARLTPTGVVDSTFNAGTNATDRAFAIALKNDGKILIGGNFGLRQLHPNGTLDESFTPQIASAGLTQVGKILVQSSGRVVISGRFTTINAITRNGIARLNPDGTLDETFIPAVESLHSSSSLTPSMFPNEKLLISGAKRIDTGTEVPIGRLLAEPVLAMQQVNSNTVLSWDEASYRLQSAPTVDSEFIDILDATSPFTNAPSGEQRYFRLFAD